MRSQTNQNHSIIILDKGEELLSSLYSYIEKEHISSSFWITGLGAAESVTLSYYDLDTKEYKDKTLNELLEILNIQGSLAFVEGKPQLHLHGVFSDKNYEAIGGHIQNLVIGITGEFHLHHLPMKLERTHNETVGLNLISLP